MENNQITDQSQPPQSSAINTPSAVGAKIPLKDRIKSKEFFIIILLIAMILILVPIPKHKEIYIGGECINNAPPGQLDGCIRTMKGARSIGGWELGKPLIFSHILPLFSDRF